MRLLAIPSILFLIIFSSCQKSTEIIQEPIQMEEEKNYPNVDERLWSYFMSFEEAARERGLLFDLKEQNILGIIENIDEQGVAGHCKYGSHIDNEVTIDNGFWSRSSNTIREFVVFHELGHCVLMRDHDETVLSNGDCESLMRSGVQNCQDNYNSNTREYYLDELFSENNS